MKSKKIYDHREKVGNAGDVWKHFILIAVTEALIKNRSLTKKSSPFIYIDTHGAEGQYLLPLKGEWRKGLGAIRPQLQKYSQWPYFRLLSRLDDKSYYGSWRLVGSYLRESDVSFELHITEKDPTVKERLDAVVGSLSFASQIHTYSQDGFQLPPLLSPADLVLVDPPYGSGSSDWDKVSATLYELNPASSFLVWYPIMNGTSKPAGLVERLGHRGYEIHWANVPNPGPSMKGCGVIAGGPADEILRRLSSELEKLSQMIAQGSGGDRSTVYVRETVTVLLSSQVM